MVRNIAKVLFIAWGRPEFRAGLRHLIDLDEVTGVLAALAADDHGDEVDLRALALLRSALETDENRRAVLLLVEEDDIRRHVAAASAAALRDQPGLARAIGSALDDPTVRREFSATLESPHVRDVVLKAAENQFRGHRWTLVGQLTVLLIRHRHARRLVWALRRHGVLHELSVSRQR